MENEFANLKSELAAITVWDRLFADLERPDEIDNDACVARFCRRQVIVQRLRELSANS
jgi:hypothetical protein